MSHPDRYKWTALSNTTLGVLMAAGAPMADAVRAMVGDLPPERFLVVGDRGSTDGQFAVTLGSPFALVRSGVTHPGDAVGVPVALDAPDLARVVDALWPEHAPG